MKDLAITFLYKGILDIDKTDKLKLKLSEHFNTKRIFVMSAESLEKTELIITEVYL